jgi:hypothetical protein
MKLKDDATVVTGANSEVSILVNNGTITLKSLTTAKLRGVAVSQASSTADVALRNGTVVSEVKQITGLKTSFTVTTPVGTSSVRGTTHSVSYSPERGLSVAVEAGTVAVASLRGSSRPVAAGSSFVAPAGAAPPKVMVQTSSGQNVAVAAAAAASAASGNAFAPAEEAAASSAMGTGSGQTATFTELVNAIANRPSTGTVELTLVFP